MLVALFFKVSSAALCLNICVSSESYEQRGGGERNGGIGEGEQGDGRTCWGGQGLRHPPGLPSHPSNVVSKIPSLCQRLHPQRPRLSYGRMLTAFWFFNCVRVALLTSQLTCFCSAVGRSSGRMMWIKRRLLQTSPPLTQWVKPRGLKRPQAQHSVGTTISFQ